MEALRKQIVSWVKPFQDENGYSIPLIIVFVCINSIVLINAILHDPRIGYDAYQHLKYIRTLSFFRMVTPEDTSEFFSPPLPYLLPALLVGLTGMKVFWAAKCAQLLNALLSVGLTFYLIKTCKLIYSRSSLALYSLIGLGIFPFYYKSFAFIRGEPYVAFFAVLIFYYTLIVFIKKSFTRKHMTCLGVSMGLCALSRQWGLLIFPAIFLFILYQWICYAESRKAIAKALCIIIIFIAVISGWFYLLLNSKHGTAIAFNRESATKFSLRNLPKDFYFGLSPRLLFTKPFRPHFNNQFFPIFYSDLWGDYWGYFIVYFQIAGKYYGAGKIKRSLLLSGNFHRSVATNFKRAVAYLGRVNRVSIFPSMFIMFSLIFSIYSLFQKDENLFIPLNNKITGMLLLIIASTMAGYFWFLIMHPRSEIDTIKATYILHALPFVSLLAGGFLEYIRMKTQRFHRWVLVGLFLCFIHNIPAMLTHYSLCRLF